MLPIEMRNRQKLVTNSSKLKLVVYIIINRCSNPMKGQIQSHRRYPNMKRVTVVGDLLKTIKRMSMQVTTYFFTNTILKAIKVLVNIEWKPEQSRADFTNEFLAVVKVLEHASGIYCIHPSLIIS